MSRGFVVVGLALIGCGDDDGTGGGTTDNSSAATGTCATNRLDAEATFPATGETDAYYRTTVEFGFVEEESAATITLADSAGADVAGTNEVVGGTHVVFTPSAPLTAGETYSATLNWSCPAVTSTFTVGAAGAPVGGGAGLVGNTYSLDIASGRFIEPPGVGDILETFLTFELYLGVEAAGASDLTFMGALANADGTQDMCTESITFPVPADFSQDPFFSVASDSLPVEVEGVAVTIDDLVLSGAFTPDGSAISGGVLAGSIDTRTLMDVLEMTTEGGVCDLLATFLIDCEPCADGSVSCLSVYVDDMSADLVPGVTLVEVTAADIVANPTCVADSTP